MTLWKGVTVIERPAGELIAIADLKQRLRIDADEDDALVAQFLAGAVRRVDGPSGIGIAMLQQKWRKSIDHFPSSIMLPGWPIKSVDALKYIDGDGVEQTMDAADYRVDLDAEPARIEPAFSKAWPAARHVVGAIKVEYTLGEADPADVPRDLVDAVCLLVGHRYEHREAVAEGSMAGLPLGFESIVAEYRRGTVAA